METGKSNALQKKVSTMEEIDRELNKEEVYTAAATQHTRMDLSVWFFFFFNAKCMGKSSPSVWSPLVHEKPCSTLSQFSHQSNKSLETVALFKNIELYLILLRKLIKKTNTSI